MIRLNLLDQIKHLLFIIFIVTLTFLVYWNCLSHEFLFNWDDPEYVVNNPAIRGLTFINIEKAFTSFYVGNYSPIQIISYMIDYSIWGLNPKGFILTNIILHACNGVLVYLILFRYFNNPLPALISALLFVSHPVQVESVAWVAQRKNVVAMFFFLLPFVF